MNQFFKNPNIWYPLGASESDPPRNGLGYFINHNCPKLTSRHASAVAAILARHLGVIEWKEDGRSISLRKKSV